MFVTSAYQLDNHAQVDGRRYVTETFVEADGTTHTQIYLASQGMDYDAVLATHAAQLWAALTDQEYAEVVA